MRVKVAIALEKAKPLIVAKHPGYDHGYCFINSFIVAIKNYYIMMWVWKIIIM